MTPDRLLFLLLLLAVGLLFPPLAEPKPWHGTFTAIFFSILLTSVPYIIIGSLLGGLIEVFMPARVLPTLVRRMGRFGIPGVALLSPVLPVCECGVLGVARGLMRKGLPLGHTTAYLLAGPVLNPMVLFTTWLAFHDRGAEMPLLRGCGALLVAVAVGWWVSRLDPRRVLLPAAAREILGEERPDLGGLLKGARRSGAIAGSPAPLASAVRTSDSGEVVAAAPGWRATIIHLARQTLDHFLSMGAFFLVGVAIAAAAGTAVRHFHWDLSSLGQGPVTGPATMMLTAFVLSLCAEADAFVAASFAKDGFGTSAIVAFLVFGPMFDIKLLLMYRAVFRTWFIAALAGAIALSTAVWVLLVALTSKVMT